MRFSSATGTRRSIGVTPLMPLVSSLSLHELENTNRSRSGLDKRTSGADELVCVFACAASFTQRRTVIDQDAHLFKSFRVSILL